jgi:hypothetical protein
MNNEAVLIGIKLVLGSDGNVYIEKIDTPLHKMQDQFLPGDYIDLAETMSKFRSRMRELEKEISV